MSGKHIAVIGAGIAGMSCAASLLRADVEVTIFERARGVGGRLTTHREQAAAFDHGAQFVTARSRPFTRYMDVATRAGVATRWRPRLLEDTRVWDEPIEEWHIGLPGMSGLVRPLGRNAHILYGTTVRELYAQAGSWEVQTADGRHKQVFDAVAVALPAPEALSLLAPHARAFRHLTDVTFAPCWSTTVAFDSPIPAPAEAMRWTQGGLSWAASQASRPGRSPLPDAWVLHASASWSREHLEADAGAASRLMLDAFAHQLDAKLPSPVVLHAHRWRHATVEHALGLPCLVDEETAAGACGDWCIAPRVEAAFESGRTLAHALLSIVGLTLPMSRG